MRTTLPPERLPKSGSWNCVGDTSQQFSNTTHPPTPRASLTQTRPGKYITCSDTVHGIRSPEAFLPRDRLFKMDWREISPSRHTYGESGKVRQGRPRNRAPHTITSVLLVLFPLQVRLNPVMDSSVSNEVSLLCPLGTLTLSLSRQNTGIVLIQRANPTLEDGVHAPSSAHIS